MVDDFRVKFDFPIRPNPALVFRECIVDSNTSADEIEPPPEHRSDDTVGAAFAWRFIVMRFIWEGVANPKRFTADEVPLTIAVVGSR